MRTFRVPVLALLLAASVTLAAPPKLDLPAEVRPAGDYARFTPETDAASVVYVGLSGVDAFPSEELRDPRRFLLPVRGLPAGRYRFAAVAAGKTGEQVRADFAVVVGPGTPTDPPTDPPVDPPVPPPAVFYFAVVRPDGPADPAFTAVMADPGWAVLRAAGHSVKDFTLTDARTRLKMTVPAGTPLPAVVTLRVAGGRSVEVRQAVPLPTTTDGIRRLPEGVQ